MACDLYRIIRQQLPDQDAIRGDLHALISPVAPTRLAFHDADHRTAIRPGQTRKSALPWTSKIADPTLKTNLAGVSLLTQHHTHLPRQRTEPNPGTASLRLLVDRPRGRPALTIQVRSPLILPFAPPSLKNKIEGVEQALVEGQAAGQSPSVDFELEPALTGAMADELTNLTHSERWDVIVVRCAHAPSSPSCQLAKLLSSMRQRSRIMSLIWAIGSRLDVRDSAKTSRARSSWPSELPAHRCPELTYDMLRFADSLPLPSELENSYCSSLYGTYTT